MDFIKDFKAKFHKGSTNRSTERSSSRTTQRDTSLKTILSKPIRVSDEQALEFAMLNTKPLNPETSTTQSSITKPANKKPFPSEPSTVKPSKPFIAKSLPTNPSIPKTITTASKKKSQKQLISSYSQTEDSKNSTFESISNVSIYDPCTEHFVPVHPKPRHNANDCINVELRYALSHSIPISSETLYDSLHFRQYPAVQDGLSYPPSQELTSKKRQRSASVQLDQSPPSLTPTDVTRAQRRTRSCERVGNQFLWANPQSCEQAAYEYHNHCESQSPALNDSEKIKSMEDYERKIIIEFCHLLVESKQLFNGLRGLPQHGHKQWSMYFGSTFDLYTRLWKYQQQHRAILDSKYGLARWQIGEIASKIGQLYYQFYLRTSEAGYLHQAFSFYCALRERYSYTEANKEDKYKLKVKQLRYYSRFIIVCLLLKKMKLVKELIKELDRQIIEYGNTYNPNDQIEWTVVVDEVKAFIHAELVVNVVNQDNYSVIFSNRLTPKTTPSIKRTPQMSLTLQKVLIVGSSSQQVKFSELTMDMFRMVQTLEREPLGDMPRNVDESPRGRYHPPTWHNPDGLQPNPHKYLLFEPSLSQILVYLANAIHDMPANGALLLYLSADGLLPQDQKQLEDVCDVGGLITASKYQKVANSATVKFKEIQCLYPRHLTPFTRSPLLIIVDSDNSYAFQSVARHFGQPMVILMSPLELPACFHDRRQQGGLFTLFIHSPLTAFCYCCNISILEQEHWDHAQHIIDNFFAEASFLLLRCRVDVSYISFLGDDFLRLLILRYVFCEVTLRLHRGFRARKHLTRCSPALPDDLLEHPTLIQTVMVLAAHLQVRSHFHDPTVAFGPQRT